MSNSKTLTGILIGTIILSFIYIGNFSAGNNLENNIFDYFGATVQAATSGNSGVSLSATVGSILTVSVDNATATFSGILTPGTAINSSTTVSVVTNNSTGYTIKVNRNNNPTSTMTLDGLLDATNTIPDYTAWDSTGDGNATTSITSLAAKLSFNVLQSGSTVDCFSITWWGTTGNEQFAGFPTSADTTFDCSGFNSATTTAKHYYRLDAPTSQYSGNYSGGITYTAAVNP